MTNLENFLNKNKIEEFLDPVDGSFACQNAECNDITTEAFLDRMHNRVKWTCINGHDSSVVI
jgi:hypothetical protein